MKFLDEMRSPKQILTCEGLSLRKEKPEKLTKNYKEKLKSSPKYISEMIKSGVVSGKYWVTTNGSCIVCKNNAKAGAIPLKSVFPSGHRYPPAGIYCTCSLLGKTDENT